MNYKNTLNEDIAYATMCKLAGLPVSLEKGLIGSGVGAGLGALKTLVYDDYMQGGDPGLNDYLTNMGIGMGAGGLLGLAGNSLMSSDAAEKAVRGNKVPALANKQNLRNIARNAIARNDAIRGTSGIAGEIGNKLPADYFDVNTLSALYGM